MKLKEKKEKREKKRMRKAKKMQRKAMKLQEKREKKRMRKAKKTHRRAMKLMKRTTLSVLQISSTVLIRVRVTLLVAAAVDATLRNTVATLGFIVLAPLSSQNPKPRRHRHQHLMSVLAKLQLRRPVIIPLIMISA